MKPPFGKLGAVFLFGCLNHVLPLIKGLHRLDISETGVIRSIGDSEVLFALDWLGGVGYIFVVLIIF